MIKQCAQLIAKSDFSVKAQGRGRPMQVKTGDRFWVTSPTYQNEESFKFNRKGKGSIGDGPWLPIEYLTELFDIVE